MVGHLKMSRRKSPVFNHFTIIPGEDKSAICKYCDGRYSFRSTLTNLKMHLKKRHFSVFTEYLADKVTVDETNLTKSLLRKPRLKWRDQQKIWNYFRKSSVGDKRATCLTCHNTFSYRTTSANLKIHLRNMHKDIFEELNKKLKNTDHSSTKLDESTDSDESDIPMDSNISEEWLLEEVEDEIEEPSELAGETKELVDPPESKIFIVETASLQSPSTSKKRKDYATNGISLIDPRKQQIDESLLNFFISDYHPFKTVEEPGFKQLINSLNSSYQLPNKKAIATTMVPSVFIKCFAEKNNIVEKNAVNVTITIDHWISTSSECYIAVSAHFLDVKYMLVSVLLRCVCLGDSTTIGEIALQLNNIINEWNLSKKVTLAITDGNFEVAEAITTIIGWDIFRCYARSINAIVSEALKPFSDLITTVSVVVHHIKTKYEVSEKLLEYQSAVQKAEQPKRLKHCVRTDWSSVFYMLQRFCEVREAVQAIVQDLEDGPPSIEENEWIALEQLCVVLQPFEEVMRKMSVENYLPGSLAIVLTNGLLSVCEQFVNENFGDRVMETVKALNLQLSKHFDGLETNNQLALCTLLDPRFKNYAFSSKSAAEKVKSRLINLVEDMLKLEPDSIPDNTVVDESCAKKRFSVWDQFKETVKTVKPMSSTATKAINEVEGYLNEPLLDREFCPREWWISRRRAYPHLSKVFRQECHVVVTSVPCSRLFTKSGQLLAERRNQLAHQEAEQLVFLHENANNVYV